MPVIVSILTAIYEMVAMMCF